MTELIDSLPDAPIECLPEDAPKIQTPVVWCDDGWTARVIKNENDDGWAVEMIKDGESEPALVGPWTMGRDKKNPKPLDPPAFHTLVKTAAEVLRRHEQQLHAQLHKRVTIDMGSTTFGRPRDIPIRTEEQRQLLDAAKALAQGGSLIPPDQSYKAHLRQFRAQCEQAGIHKVHGHRHCYAQERYRELTGWECPAYGGPTARQLSAEQKRIDRKARLTISSELGHGREQITSVYLGR